MSRREDSDSHGKRLHSGSERERSLKRSRRDGKPATGKTYSSSRSLDIDGTTDQDHKHSRRLQDALSVEPPPATATEVKPDIPTSGSERMVDGLPAGTKLLSQQKYPALDPIFRFPISTMIVAVLVKMVEAMSIEKLDNGRWSDPKDQSGDSIKNKGCAADLPKKDEKMRSRAYDNNVWRHDGFFQLEAEAPPSRKRPAFAEKKMPRQPESSAVATGSQPKDHHDQPVLGVGRREVLVSNHSHGTK